MSLSHKELENFAQRAAAALRSSIARDIHQLGHRAFSRHAADSDCVRKLMHLIELDGKKTTISKSASQRHATFVSAAELRERMQTDPAFRGGQKHRASTEARISILANNFGDKPTKAKGFAHREQAVGISVLAHNLCKVARLAQAAAQAAKAAV